MGRADVTGINPPLRITYVIDSLGQGGAERSMLEIVRSIGDRLDPEIVVLHDRDDLKAEADRFGIAVVSLAGHGSPATVRHLTRHLRARRPELVHTTLYRANVLGRPAARAAGVPVVSSLVNTPYGPSHLGEPGLSAARVRAAQAVDLATCRLVRRFHANAHHIADTMARRLRIDPARIDVVPRGRHPEAFGVRSDERTQVVREGLGLAGGPLVVALARHEHQKGLDVLLEAVAVCTQPIEVVVAGRPGNATPALQAQSAALGVTDRVHLIGHRDDVADLLAAADAFVLPSRREGFPGVVVEAMAVGTPVVASDLPGVREALGDGNGWLVPPGDDEALAAALDEVTRDPDEPAVRAGRARVRFLEHFTIERTAEAMFDFYERALGRSGSDGRA